MVKKRKIKKENEKSKENEPKKTYHFLKISESKPVPRVVRTPKETRKRLKQTKRKRNR